MMWRNEPEIEAARRQPGWVEFHRACGRGTVYFDHIEKAGRRGPFSAVAWTMVRRDGAYTHSEKLAEGRGPTPIAAIADAYRKSGRPVADAELARLIADPATFADDIDLEDILG